VNKTQEQFPRQGEYFSFDGEALIPEQTAVSGWGANLMFGPAVTAALARGAELACPAPDLQPAKASFDLFRPALMMPSTVRTTVVRQGRRLCLIDVAFVQDDMDIARGQVTFLLPSTDPAGPLWRPAIDVAAPDESLYPDVKGRLYRSEKDWSGDAGDHANDARKQVWQCNHPLVRGERPTPFQLAAAASDLTSLVVHWGAAGIEFINPDVTLTLSRMPRGSGIGLKAAHISSTAGISAGSAILFDEAGVFGTSSVSGLANGGRIALVRSIRAPEATAE
jgi:hypothetical protein